MFRHLLSLGLPKDRGFILGLALASFEGLSAIALLGCSAWLISAAAEQPPIMYLNMVIVGVRGFALGRAFFRYTQRLTLHDSAFRLQTTLRPSIIRAISPLVPAGLKEVSRGSVSSQLVTDVEEIQNLGVRTVAPVVQSLLAAILTITALAVLAPATASWLILSALLIASALLALPISAVWNQRQVSASALNRNQLQADAVEYLENLETLAAFEWEGERREKLTQLDRSLSRSNSRFALTAGFGAATFSAASTFAVCLLAYTSATAVQTGQLDHRFVAVVALIPLAVFEIWSQLQPAMLSLQKYLQSARRVIESVEAKIPVVIQASDGTSTLDSVTSLDLQNLEVGYPDSSLLGPYSLRLNQGDTLIVRGASGSGKTTLAFAIAGFLKPQSGSYLVNGKDIGEYSEASIRERIGYLEQIPTIFDGSVKTNLQVGKPQASEQEMWQVLERVGLAKTFEARDGLETELGERGAALSGGEAQRLSLARALLANFQVLIFDEPTANVDQQLASKLWDDLMNITKADARRISIFISHDSELPTHGASILQL